MRPVNNDPVKQCLIIYHIRMDTPETQKHFSKLRTLIQRDSNSRCRQRNNRDHTEQHYIQHDIHVYINVGANIFWLNLFYKKCSKKYPPKTWTIDIFILFPCNRIPRPHEVSLPKSSSEATAVFALRIHGRLRLQEPLDHGIAAVVGCVVQRCFASGAAARDQATGRTQRKEGEKIRRKFRRLKSRSFGNFGHSKILPELREQCGFEDVLMTSSWLKKAMWTKLAVKMHCGNWKRCSISKKTNMRAIGTQPNLKSIPYSRYFL